MTRLVTILIAVAIAAQAWGQNAIGSLKTHPTFGNVITRICDTGQMVYYLSDGNLYSYDKENNESDHYSRNNRLNQAGVDDIFYNYDKGYLVVTYTDANIDILTDDGHTIPLPDIASAQLQIIPEINDVKFSADRMFVATNFGIVVYNDQRWEVEYSRNFGMNIYSVTGTDNYLWVNADSLRYCPLNNPARTLAEMPSARMHESARLHRANGDTIIFASGWTYRLWINNAGSTSTGLVANQTASSFHPIEGGFLMIDNPRNNVYYLNRSGTVTDTYPLPDDMRVWTTWQRPLVSSREAKGQLWELSLNGLRHLQVDQEGNTTILSDYYRPNASTVRQPINLAFNDATGELLVANGAATTNNTFYRINTVMSRLNDGWWENALPSEFPQVSPSADGTMKDIYQPVFCPFDSETYFIGSRYEGAFQIRGNEVVAKYDYNNSPIQLCETDNTMAVPALAFDNDGNLWMLQSPFAVQLMMLPHDKVLSTSVSASDWVVVDATLSDAFFINAKMLITRRNQIKVLTDGTWEGSLYFVYDGGNPQSSNIETRSYHHGMLYDQDGTAYSWRYLNCLAEDNNGTVWMGTTNGVVYFNPDNAFDSGFSVTRPRIPRNDGTNYADNLLDGITVYCIAVDGANRKWIGTATNGLYLVNADGSEVLQHYTTDNSALPSNYIYSVCCSTTSNSVFVGTDNGLVELFSDASQPSADYNSVYAYPNPVRPEYTGDIAITGLMEGSLVKITDAAGNVVRSLQSTGGTAMWDGCNAAGHRVKTGIYYVLASQSDGSSSSGKVATKILFVR